MARPNPPPKRTRSPATHAAAPLSPATPIPPAAAAAAAGASPPRDPDAHLLDVLTGAAPVPPPKKARHAPARAAAAAAWPEALPTRARNVRVTVLLHSASLETVQRGGGAKGRAAAGAGVELLSSDAHAGQLRKAGRPLNDARPDIAHQCLLALQDSPLNKAGRLRVFVRTARGVLIDVHASTRVPRTMRRFGGLMAELLEKMKVRGGGGGGALLKVVRNPVTGYLPVGTRKIVCTYNTENVVDVREHAAKVVTEARREIEERKRRAGEGGRAGEREGKEEGAEERDEEEEEEEEDGEEVNVLYVIGAMAHGKVEEEWADEYVCISEYPLSAATVCGRVTYAYECMLGIL